MQKRHENNRTMATSKIYQSCVFASAMYWFDEIKQRRRRQAAIYTLRQAGRQSDR